MDNMKYSYLLPTLAAGLAVVGNPLLAHGADAAATTTNQWQSSASAGLTLTRGNSDTLLATLSLGTGKKWDQNELSLGADGTYGQTKQTVSTGPGTHTTDNTTTA